MFYGDPVYSDVMNGEHDQDEAQTDITLLISNHGNAISNSISISCNEVENNDDELDQNAGNDSRSRC